MEFPDFPRVIRIEPSGICNLKCTHCPTGTVEIERGMMNEDVFERVFEDISKNSKKVKVVVMYHGGEPLLNPNVENMIKRIKLIGIEKVKTVSNGMLLSPERSQRLVKSGLDEIEISLDGTTPEENDSIRRGSDFRKVSRNIISLIEEKKRFQSRTPIIYIATTQFGSENVPEYLEREFGEYIKSGEIAGFKSCEAMVWPDMRIEDDKYCVSERRIPGKYNYCDHLFSTFTIRWNGDVVACCYDLTSIFVAGNIMKNSISDIWKNERYQSIRMRVAEGNPIGPCANCNSISEIKKFLVKKII